MFVELTLFQKALTALKNLDLHNNDVTKLTDYKTHMFSLIPTLESLDGYNKIGEEIFSEDESDYGAYGEEGEEDMDGIDMQLTEEQLGELKKRGISLEDFMAGKGDLAEFGEEGEDDMDGEEGEEEYGDEDDRSEPSGAAGNKRAKN